MIAALAALAAAACFAAAAAFMHRAAGAVQVAGGGALRFVAGNLRQPLWIVGMVAESAGFALHALAVHSGPLTLVQPLLVSGLVFALPLRQVVERRRPLVRELAWAALLVGGLALFLLSASPAHGPASAPDTLPTAVAVLVGLAVLAVLTVAGLRASGPRAAILLGSAAGLAFAAVAGLLKVVTDELAAGPAALLGEWPLYALVAVGPVGLALSQLAYRAAPLRHSLPALSTVDPIASLVLGVAVFDEPFRVGAAAVAGEVAGLAVVLATAVALGRSGEAPITTL